MIDYVNSSFELQCAIEDQDIIHIEQVLLRAKDCLNAVCLGEDQTPLAYACVLGCGDVVRFLIEKGADVNVRMGEDGETALFQAVLENKFEIVKLLVEYGAKIKIQDYQGNTPLDYAVFENDNYENDIEGLRIMSKYLQECFDRENSWCDAELFGLE
jgi:Ankyrin repeats (many copies)